MTKLDRMLGRLTAPCTGRGWELYGAVRGIHKEKPLKVKAVWNDSFKADNPDLYSDPDMNEETTFADCVTWEIHKGRKVIFRLYDGDTCTGYRLQGGPRCTFTVYGVPTRFLTTAVKESLKRQAVHAEEREELARRDARVSEIYKELCT